MIQLIKKLKKFRVIYYIIYVIFVGFLFYIAYDLVDIFDLLRKNGWYLSEIPSLASKLMFFVVFVMLFELGYENFIRVKERRKVTHLEKEITELKAKLYDQGQVEAPIPTQLEEDSNESDSNQSDASEDDEEDILDG